MERNQLLADKAAERVDAQLPAEEKKSYADFVIDTSGSLADTERQVKAVWKKLVEMAAARSKK